MKKKVLVGLSGGIDSSIVAQKLKHDGYDVVGVYMKLHTSNEQYHKKNLDNIDKISSYLDIKYHVIDFTKEFKEDVYDYFVSSYIDGSTPNPCMVCNKTIKFGSLLQYAKSLKINYIATGHYVKSDGRYLYKAKDESKDQSYFLANIDKDIIPYLIFPLWDSKKEDIIKNIPQNSPLFDIAKDKESNEICFVENTYLDILKQHTDPNKSGVVKNSSNEIIGTHKGYMHYTIGKRKGFDIPLAHERHYVTKIDAKNNIIFAGKKEELKTYNIQATNVNMFEKLEKFSAEVKVRYRSNGIMANIEIVNDIANIKLVEPAFGVAIGQYAVFYIDDRVVGSAKIFKYF